MSAVFTFKRCVGESPPDYGSRRAYCFVKPDFTGRCCLHYEVDSTPQVVGFTTYQQALTAATMAIFFLENNFQQVTIKAYTEPDLCHFYSSAKAWLAHHRQYYGSEDSAVRA